MGPRIYKNSLSTLLYEDT